MGRWGVDALGGLKKNLNIFFWEVQGFKGQQKKSNYINYLSPS